MNELLNSNVLARLVDKASSGVIGEFEKMKSKRTSNPLQELTFLVGAIAQDQSKHQVIAEMHARVMRSALDAVLRGLSEQSYRMVAKELKSLRLKDVLAAR
ncbi:MAG: hypothetical protein FD180_1819 [Planctomycetota bacterium]|nr:MAG: hypothetical protein FD180_1819 [Planctomycetota bacterium]